MGAVSMVAAGDSRSLQSSFERLVSIMAKLRSPEGCPWDRAQTHSSLRRYLIEETYEAIDAIDSGDMSSLCEELGDILLQIVFHAQIAAETGAFTIDDVVTSLADKLVRRHPHVFGDEKAVNVEEVADVWQAVKAAENESKAVSERHASLLDGIPRHLPALMYAEALGERAARVGFDWDNVEEVWQKTLEEQAELAEAINQREQNGDAHKAQTRIEEEWGDLVFSLVNLARHLRLDPEAALRQAAAKFADRFRAIERMAQSQGSSLEELSLDAMNELWEQAKQNQD